MELQQIMTSGRRQRTNQNAKNGRLINSTSALYFQSMLLPDIKVFETRYFRKFETFHPHPDFPLDSSKRGNEGPIQVSPFNGFWGLIIEHIMPRLAFMDTLVALPARLFRHVNPLGFLSTQT
jgi:hypothetical protein